MKNEFKVVFDMTNEKSIMAAEKLKAKYENLGYKLINSDVGFNNTTLVYVR